MRDFTFVEDTVDGFLRMGWHEGAVGQEINIGAGDCISIGDLAQKILALVGRDLPIICEGQRLRPPQSEVMRLHASTEKAHRLIGWEPHTSLDEGLQHTIAWIREHITHYRPQVYEV
jgi:dTDP-glucose 4,6-dehydratase